MLPARPLSVIVLIGIILLLRQIVKTNALMMSDFALDAERRGLSAERASIAPSSALPRPIMDDDDGRRLGWQSARMRAAPG